MHMCLCGLLYRFQPDGMWTDLKKFIDGPSSYLSLPDELKSAIDAITYIAEALQAEKDYEAVSATICVHRNALGSFSFSLLFNLIVHFFQTLVANLLPIFPLLSHHPNL